MTPKTYSLPNTDLDFYGITATRLDILQKGAATILKGIEDPGLEEVLAFLYILDTRHSIKHLQALLKSPEEFDSKISEYGELFTMPLLTAASTLIETICEDAMEGMIEPDPLAPENEKKTPHPEPHPKTSSSTTTSQSAPVIPNRSSEITTTCPSLDFGPSSIPPWSPKAPPADT